MAAQFKVQNRPLWGGIIYDIVLFFAIDICQSIMLSFKSSFTKDLSFWGPLDISLHISNLHWIWAELLVVDLYLNALNEERVVESISKFKKLSSSRKFFPRKWGTYLKNHVSWIWRDLFRLARQWKLRYINPRYVCTGCSTLYFFDK